MATNDGGPAFPQGVAQGDGGPPVCSYDFADGGGMSLRDYFAGQALAGLLARTDLTTLSEDDIAAWAGRQADSMLAERERSR